MSVGHPEDKFSIDNPRLGAFIAEVRTLVARATSPIETVAALREPFSRLLADRTWLPSAFRQPSPQSGMGGGISSWLVYRSADRSLTLMSLVVPPESATPIHDHLSWGLVGLYDGTQEERVFRELGRSGDGHRQLELVTVPASGRTVLRPHPPEERHPQRQDHFADAIDLSPFACHRHRMHLTPHYTNVGCGDGSEPGRGALNTREDGTRLTHYTGMYARARDEAAVAAWRRVQ